MRRASGPLWDFGAVAAAFAEAAVDPSRWAIAMDAVAEASGGVGALLFPLQGRLPGIPMSPRLTYLCTLNLKLISSATVYEGAKEVASYD